MSKAAWQYINSFDEYYDFVAELVAFPDEGRSSIDVRMTFNTETHTCCLAVLRKNDDGDTALFGPLEGMPAGMYIDWDAGLQKLRADGVAVPAELSV
jgi:hypothetical protein